MSKQDYLNKDPSLDGQNYVCLSFLTPSKEDQTTLTGIKVRGVFNEYEEACQHAKKLQEMDPAFGVFVGEVGKWLPYDPDPESKYVKSSEYANDELNDIMKNYLINQEKAKVYHEKRKNEMTRKSLEENLQNITEQYKNTKGKLKNPGKMKDIFEKRVETMGSKMKEMEERIKYLKKEEEKYLKQMQEMDKQKPVLKVEPPRNVDL